MLVQLEMCLDYTLEKHDPALLTAKEVAKHTNKLKEHDFMTKIDSSSNLFIPNL